jgi:hypothetical protein
VAEGTPEEIAQIEESFTGQYLRRALGGRNGRRDGRAAAVAAPPARAKAPRPKPNGSTKAKTGAKARR